MEFHLFDIWWYNREKCYQVSFISFMSSELDYSKSLLHFGYHREIGFTIQLFFKDLL